MSSIQGILKGGKSGKLFVTGKPEISLLLERIHLPLEDKKHMPLSGQPQLTDEEKMILTLWIKGNATFTKKCWNYPEQIHSESWGTPYSILFWTRLQIMTFLKQVRKP